MKLPEYASFEDKMQYFETNQKVIGNSWIINTEQEFEEMFQSIHQCQQKINECSKNTKIRFRESIYFKNASEEQLQRHFITMGLDNGLFFRGVCEAKYKIYTSAQRCWLENEHGKKGLSYINFIEGLLKQIRQNNLLHDYYTALRVPENDLLYMSLLQHYGQCSPLIDISYSIESSLYFALDGANFKKTTNEIDNYCSLYIFNTYANQYWATLDTILQEGQEKAAELLEDLKHPVEMIDTSNIDSADKYTCWINANNNNRGLHDWALTLIKLPTANGAIMPITRTGEHICWTNLNLLAQKGGFFLYTKDTTPLEEHIYHNQELPNVICFNIHKGLKDYILNRIRLTKDNIYPQMENIIKNDIKAFTNNLQNKQ